MSKQDFKAMADNVVANWDRKQPYRLSDAARLHLATLIYQALKLAFALGRMKGMKK